jgi:hypothetical protein
MGVEETDGVSWLRVTLLVGIKVKSLPEYADVTAGVVRENITGEVVLESTSTEGKNESSAQQSMQSMHTSSELGISQKTTQSGSMMTGANVVDYTRLHGRDASKTLVANESSGQYRYIEALSWGMLLMLLMLQRQKSRVSL